MFHIFHKWKTVKRVNSIVSAGPDAEEQSHAVIEVQACTKCEERRAFKHLLDGSKRRVDPGFAEEFPRA